MGSFFRGRFANNALSVMPILFMDKKIFSEMILATKAIIKTTHFPVNQHLAH